MTSLYKYSFLMIMITSQINYSTTEPSTTQETLQETLLKKQIDAVEQQIATCKQQNELLAISVALELQKHQARNHAQQAAEIAQQENAKKPIAKKILFGIIELYGNALLNDFLQKATSVSVHTTYEGIDAVSYKIIGRRPCRWLNNTYQQLNGRWLNDTYQQLNEQTDHKIPMHVTNIINTGLTEQYFNSVSSNQTQTTFHDLQTQPKTTATNTTVASKNTVIELPENNVNEPSTEPALNRTENIDN